MLINLHIVNLALIDELDVDFAEGLNILTGIFSISSSLADFIRSVSISSSVVHTVISGCPSASYPPQSLCTSGYRESININLCTILYVFFIYYSTFCHIAGIMGVSYSPSGILSNSSCKLDCDVSPEEGLLL